MGNGKGVIEGERFFLSLVLTLLSLLDMHVGSRLGQTVFFATWRGVS